MLTCIQVYTYLHFVPHQFPSQIFYSLRSTDMYVCTMICITKYHAHIYSTGYAYVMDMVIKQYSSTV